jgi:aminoglycoside phosphotransferase (APT) family kinase protein
MTTQQLDTITLGDYLAAHIPGFNGPVSAEKFAGGQSNPTFKLTAGDQAYVLRRKPPGELLKSAHAVDREFRVISALQNTDVPVPKTYLLCEDEAVIGSMFYIMEYMEGRILWDPLLPEAANNEERSAIYDAMNQTMAALHNVNVDAVGLTDFGRPGNYFERQLGRWAKQYKASETRHIAAMETLMTWLPANMPADDGTVNLVHGDYRLDNMMFHPTEPRVIALLDWELSTLGHPLGDLGYSCMPYHGGVAGKLSLDGRVGPETGIPTESEFVEDYCRHTGRESILNWNFYLAFSFFRLASILQGVYKRGIMGIASSTEALERGSLAREVADVAWSLIEKAE